ncbi:MAG: VCBS repeat-containing protein [Pyrinomonadaceae bacterium]|nr:VCBS repeat-containing protein [Pyrinomonadaceae bacterium]
MAAPRSPFYNSVLATGASFASFIGLSESSAVTTRTASGNKEFDFDFDGKADFARWQPSSGEWKIKNSNGGNLTTLTLGNSTSKLAPGDFDGDMKTDIAVFSSGTWTIKPSSGSQYTHSWGASGDLAATGDYNGDGRSDYAVFRPSTATWWIQLSSDFSYSSTVFGASSDILVQGDYDGDSKTDLAVFRPATGQWHVKNSFSGTTTISNWGVATDIPVPADYDGDGKTDLAVYRPSSGTWYIYKSSGGGSYIQQIWGNYGDQPVPADYDSDGLTDLAIWRPKTGVWFVYKSCNFSGTCGSNGQFIYESLGITSDVPVESAYVKKIGGVVQDYEHAKLRLSPKNSTGGTDLYSRNFAWSSGLVGLPGRAGLGAGFGISYNSLVWLKDPDNNVMIFDPDQSNVSPGFRMGFPTIEPVYWDKDNGRFSYLMVAPSGARLEFRQIGASDTYETADSSYLQLKTVGASSPNDPIESIQITVTATDGSQMKYQWIAGAFRLSEIKDRNGNYISVVHDQFGLLRTVTDTLGRIVTVNYDNEFYPVSITQDWKTSNGAGTSAVHTWAAFNYSTITVSPSFSSGLGVFGPSNGTSIKVFQKITSADGSYTTFEYNNFGQVSKVNNYAPDWHLLNYVRTDLQNPASNQNDCPRFSQTSSWVENFNGGNEVVINNSYAENQTIPQAGGTGVKIEVSMVGHPNSAVTKTFVGQSDWTESLPLVTEDWADNGSGFARQRWSQTVWTQDDTNLSYVENPRVVESFVGDNVSVRKSQTIYRTYPQTNIAEYGLVAEQLVFDADQTTVLKKVEMEYNFDPVYVSRRIIGLPLETRGFGRDGGILKLVSKMTYAFDQGDFNDSTLEQNISNAVNHDNVNFSASFVAGRANLTSTTRWNADFPTSSSEAVTSHVKYNIAGAPVAQVDPMGRVSKISYADNWNAGSLPANTYAYPTKLFDPAGNFSEVKYRFDTGANVWARSPAPAGNSVGKTTERLYDSLGRLDRETIVNSGAYTRYEYPSNGVQAKVYSTIVDTNNNGADAADEVLSESWSDGAGRVLRSRTEHPGSIGGFAASLAEYDVLGRLKRSSVPTEVDSSWNPAGDDLARGWLWTSQEYDWKGRVTREINTDGTDRLTTYEGCGCAGGQITTVKGELTEVPNQPNTQARRSSKAYSDILGRTYKIEALDWDANVYSTIKTIYNGSDQAVETIKFEGDENSASFQTSTATYDGFGRITAKHQPQQQLTNGTPANTTYSYNLDGTIASKTDSRGSTTNYTYSNRGLPIEIQNVVPQQSALVAAPLVTVVYDAVGNPVSMNTAGSISTSFTYNSLSQVVAERQTISDLPNAPVPNNEYKIDYSYNLSGGLAAIIDPFGQHFIYGHDKVGRLKEINGSVPFAEVTNYLADVKYRAWGSARETLYGNGTKMNASFDSKLRASGITYAKSSDGSNLMRKNYEYFQDGNLKYIQDPDNPIFDRSFKYDFNARLTEARTGAEARGQNEPDATKIPFRENFTHNAFGQITNRTGDWKPGTNCDNVINQNNSYQNNRNTGTGWLYDSDGRVLHGQGIHREYDGGGNLIKTWDGSSSYILNFEFDANGREIKRTETLFDPVEQNWDEPESNYYLRSAVLGGRVLTELADDGQKKIGFVFAGAEILARQEVDFENPSQTKVKWEIWDASRNSRVETDKNGNIIPVNFVAGGKFELDPLGNNSNYACFPPYPDRGFGTIQYQRAAIKPFPENHLSYGTMCYFDGIPTLCEQANMLFEKNRDSFDAEFFDDIPGAFSDMTARSQLDAEREATRSRRDDYDSSSILISRTYGDSSGGNIVVVGYENTQMLSTNNDLTISLNVYGIWDDRLELLWDTLLYFINSEECAKAFKNAGVVSVPEQLGKGVVIVSQNFVQNSSDDKQWAPDSAMAMGMRSGYEEAPYTNDVTYIGPYNGIRYISLSNRAFNEADDHFSVSFIHAFVHSGGKPSSGVYIAGYYNNRTNPIVNPKTNRPISGTGGPRFESETRGDLEWMGEDYNKIIETCTPEGAAKVGKARGLRRR